jgi:hypothetical protein
MTKPKKNSPAPKKELSERGIHLEKSHKEMQGNSPGFGKKFIVGQDDNGKDVFLTIGQRCGCGRRVRGRNHLEGAHHNKRVPRCGSR